jgi:hypothetical protein
MLQIVVRVDKHEENETSVTRSKNGTVCKRSRKNTRNKKGIYVQPNTEARSLKRCYRRRQ